MNQYDKNSPASIRRLFDSIARNYDKTNEALSFYLNRRWNQTLIDELLLPAKPKKFLDLCCGTGAIAFNYLKKTKEPVCAYLLDFSEEMLKQARSAADKLGMERHQLIYLQADAQKIPLTSSEVSCVTLAYGIRNVADPRECIREVHRILEPGGRFGILELTQPKNRLLKWGHQFYLRSLVPWIGKLLTSNEQAYQYLTNSIQVFIPPEQLESLLREEGFIDIRQKPLFGGTATLLTGTKF